MKTRAAFLSAAGEDIRVDELDLLEPRADEVQIRVHAAGVCHSDWHVVTGATPHPLPVVLGHEGAGIVEAVGPGVEGIVKGDHVALNWAPSCGTCFYCRQGKRALCETFVKPVWAGTMFDGTTRFLTGGKPVYHFSSLACFAEHTVVPRQSCVRIPRSIPFEVAALIGCAVTTGVGAVLNTARVKPGSSVAVFGCGGVGLSIILGARLADCPTIIGVDRVAGKSGVAKAVGATHFVTGADAVDRIKALTGDRGADYVFEAIGVPEVQEAAFTAVRPGGTLVLAGISPVGTKSNFSGALMTRQEITVMGSYYGSSDPAHDFPKLAGLFEEGKLPIDRLVGTRYKLDDINEAYADMLGGDKGRGVILV